MMGIKDTALRSPVWLSSLLMSVLSCVFRTVSPELKSYALGVLFLLLRLIGRHFIVFVSRTSLMFLYPQNSRSLLLICIVTHPVISLTLACYSSVCCVCCPLLSCRFALWCKCHLSWDQLDHSCPCKYKGLLNSNWCALWPFDLLSVHNPLMLQVSSPHHWSLAWASTPPVSSGAPSAARRAPACSTTT